MLPACACTSCQLVSEALLERVTQPQEIARAARDALRAPRRLAHGVRDRLQASGALTFAGLQAPPVTPLNARVGPHRRYTWVDAELSELQSIKDSLGGTVNDAVLAVVAGALGRYLREHDVDTRELVLRALVPVSVHAASGSIANEIAPLAAALPVGVEDPVEQYRAVRAAAVPIDDDRQTIDARTLTELDGLASPTLMSQAARLQRGQRRFDLVVTNVPGPQRPLYLLGRRLRALYPVVPISGHQALGIAVMSYDGRLGFGLLADYAALADLDVLADHLRASIDALSAGASIPRRAAHGRRSAAGRRPAASPR